MADYATRRIEAGKWIEKYISSVKITSISTIEYNISRNFGFGSSFVIKYLKLLSDVGMIKIDYKENMVYMLNHPPTPEEVREEAETEFFLKEQQYTPPSKPDE